MEIWTYKQLDTLTKKGIACLDCRRYEVCRKELVQPTVLCYGFTPLTIERLQYLRNYVDRVELQYLQNYVEE